MLKQQNVFNLFANKKIENKIVGKPCKIRKSLCKHFCKQYKVGIRANFFIYLNVNGGEIIMADVTVQKMEDYQQIVGKKIE